jgi:DNA-binding NarL/FixJ family response regulator
MLENGCKIKQILRALPYSEKKGLTIIQRLKKEGAVPKRKTTSKELVLCAYNSGIKNPYEIAEKYGYSVNTVQTILSQAKLKRQRPKKNFKYRGTSEISKLSEKTQNILEAVQDGISPKKVATMYGVTRQYVYVLKAKYLTNKRSD